MIGKELSSERNLPFSVPQGSCAGAQLFNLYCSTLHEVVISSEEDEKPLSLYGSQMTIEYMTNSRKMTGLPS